MGQCLGYFFLELFLLLFKSDELQLNHEGVDTAQELTVFQVIYKEVSWKAVRSEKCWSSIMSLDVSILHSAPKGNMAKVEGNSRSQESWYQGSH